MNNLWFFVLLLGGISSNIYTYSGNSGFIAKQGGEIIKTQGAYTKRQFPFSTFKVALALMGFDAGILISKDSPRWEWKEEYEQQFQPWYRRELGLKYHWCQPHTPESFMKYSVVWFSHQITARLGAPRFQDYVKRFQYGNEDVSGTADADDGLLNSWLGTSLTISPREQVEFLEKLLNDILPVSKKAQALTRKIMNRNEHWHDWQLFGKTGGGSSSTGWFIGWLQKDAKQPIIFAQYLDISDNDLNETPLPKQESVGLTAKEVSRMMLANYIQY